MRRSFVLLAVLTACLCPSTSRAQDPDERDCQVSTDLFKAKTCSRRSVRFSSSARRSIVS
jgi:hypothetical protein